MSATGEDIRIDDTLETHNPIDVDTVGEEEGVDENLEAAVVLGHPDDYREKAQPAV